MMKSIAYLYAKIGALGPSKLKKNGCSKSLSLKVETTMPYKKFSSIGTARGLFSP